MTEKRDSKHDSVASGSPNAKEHRPDHKGGDAVRNAQSWGGGSSASKGGSADRRNQNSSGKS